jgi:uncharacterized protein (DUF1697 family)
VAAYIAMLRGVNVGGNALKMEWLRKACEDIGLRDVRTYVQSGNIVFTSRLGASRLGPVIKARVDAQTRLPVTVIVRSAAEMARIVAENPFLKQKDVDPAKLHVTFLEKAVKPAKPALERLDALAGARDKYRMAGGAIYVHCPLNYGETKLSNTAIEKVLRVGATTRNWKTVTALRAMAES